MTLSQAAKTQSLVPLDEAVGLGVDGYKCPTDSDAAPSRVIDGDGDKRLSDPLLLKSRVDPEPPEQIPADLRVWDLVRW